MHQLGEDISAGPCQLRTGATGEGGPAHPGNIDLQRMLQLR